MREMLIDLLMDQPITRITYEEMEKYSGNVADYLIDNDVVLVVRCKNCKHLNVLNRKDIYAHCPKTNTVFLPFELDTRTHFCSLAEKGKNND